MHSWKAGYVNELLMLLYRRKVILFSAVSVVIPILLTVSLHALQPILGLLAAGQSFSLTMLGMYTAIWIPLFIFMITADLFPNEIATRTLKLALLRPTSRLKVYGAKAAALATGIAALLLLLGIVTFLCSLFTGTLAGFSEAMETMKAYTASFVAMLALSAVYIFVAQFFKSTNGFMIFSIVLYAAAKIAPFLSRSFAAFSPASYTDWYRLWLSRTVSAGTLTTATLFLLSCCMLFYSLGYYTFVKKEV